MSAAAPVTDGSPLPLAVVRLRHSSRRRMMFVAAAFLAGTLVGVSVAMMAAPSVLAHRMTRARAGDMTKAMTSQLNLTPEQQAKVGAAVAPHTMAIRAIMGDAWAKVGQELKGMDRDVMPLLTPEQQNAWRARAERMRHFGPHQPGDDQHSRLPVGPGSPAFTPVPPSR